MPDWLCAWARAWAVAAARARDEAVGAANPALERVLLTLFSPIEDAGVAMVLSVRKVEVALRLGVRERRDDTELGATLAEAVEAGGSGL